jgi:hypothetical protein
MVRLTMSKERANDEAEGDPDFSPQVNDTGAKGHTVSEKSPLLQ